MGWQYINTDGKLFWKKQYDIICKDKSDVLGKISLFRLFIGCSILTLMENSFERNNTSIFARYIWHMANPPLGCSIFTLMENSFERNNMTSFTETNLMFCSKYHFLGLPMVFHNKWRISRVWKTPRRMRRRRTTKRAWLPTTTARAEPPPSRHAWTRTGGFESLAWAGFFSPSNDWEMTGYL